MATAAAKGRTVRFEGRVFYGFKHDTPGHEATKNPKGEAITDARQFEPGEEFEFHANESDVVEEMLASGLVTAI